MGKRSGSLAPGTLVSIPIGPETFAVGQVMVAGDVFYLAVDLDERRTFDDDATFGPRLFAWTTDGQLYRDEWNVIGARYLPATYPRPDYRYAYGGEMMIESFDRANIRPFDPSRDQHVRYRSSQSPLLIEDAVKAFNGRGDWLPLYDKLIAH